jgi:triosephosphate isomerase
MIVINTKNYKTGAALLKLAKEIEKIDTHMILAVPATELTYLSKKTVLPIYAQHLDAAYSEKSTGFITPEDIKSSGAHGTLLNHSEHPLPFETLKKTIALCKKDKLTAIVCTSSLTELKKIAALEPPIIAFEEPALIGTGKSITSVKPKELAECAAYLKKRSSILLCGAGISSLEDVQVAYSLGCKGVLIASAIADAKNPIPILKQLANWETKLLDE